MNLTDKRILVIGGAGFIGSHTIEKLVNKKVKEIIIFDNFIRGSYENIKIALKDPRVKLFSKKADILNLDDLDKAMTNIDGVFHFAALWLLECHEYPEKAFEVNVRGAFNVINMCMKKKIKKLVFSSSASVYGDALHEPMEENHPFNNQNFYGATKIASEAMITSYYYRYNLNFVGLRYMNVYGPRQDFKGAYISVIMKMLKHIERGKPPVVLGNGTESFDFVNVEDCALANILAMKSNISGEFYNVGTGKKTSLKDLAKIILNVKQSSLRITYKKNINKNLVKNRVGSTKKAYRDLRFKSKVKLEDGLKSLIEWKEKL